tara:strand:+ start:1491 stop:2462 length:972 start_codon:yes stop_codon:yes gene_type:complete
MKKIILVSGDPNSINSEIIFKSWKKLSKSKKKKIYLISNYNLLKQQFKKLNYKIKIQKVENNRKFIENDNLKIIDIKLKFKNPFKVEEKEASKFVMKSIDLGHKLSLNKKKVAGLINCPINKNLLNSKFLGITEYLANKCKIRNKSEVMLINNEKLSVSPITTHINIREVPNKINKLVIIKKVNLINTWFKNYIKKKPYIGILGLNPHNAELKSNSEEKKIIMPAIKNLKKLGIKVEGPLSSDTVFISNYKKFDVIVGMYHDQVLSPFKTLFKYDAINLTIGLKYFRISPDHGTAVNLVGKNKANPLSLIKCINTLFKLSKYV